MIGRIRPYFPEGSRSHYLVLSTVFCSSTDAMSQPAAALSGEQYINIFQTEEHPNYKLAMEAAKVTYKAKFPLLHDEFQIVDF